MRAKIGALLSIAFPLLAGRQESPRFIGFVPKSVSTQGVVRESDDFLFVLVYPCQPLVERHLILLPVTVGGMDRQPISAALSERFAFREFEQRPSDVVGLRVYQLRHRIRASAMVQLVGKKELRFIQQPLRERQAESHDLLEAFDAVFQIERVGALPLAFDYLLWVGVVRQSGRELPKRMRLQAEE